jgi:hypothetical protein
MHFKQLCKRSYFSKVAAFTLEGAAADAIAAQVTAAVPASTDRLDTKPSWLSAARRVA